MWLSTFMTWTLQNLSGSTYYYSQLVDWISPAITFMYDNLLTNPIFYWIIITILVVSVFSFSD